MNTSGYSSHRGPGGATPRPPAAQPDTHRSDRRPSRHQAIVRSVRDVALGVWLTILVSYVPGTFTLLLLSLLRLALIVALVLGAAWLAGVIPAKCS